MTADTDLRVTDNPPRRRYELHLADRLVGVIDYRTDGDVVVLAHVEVDRTFRGRGFGSRLVAGALDDIRARGLSVAPDCPFAAWYVRRHPEVHDLVVRSDAGDGTGIAPPGRQRRASSSASLDRRR